MRKLRVLLNYPFIYFPFKVIANPLHLEELSKLPWYLFHGNVWIIETLKFSLACSARHRRYAVDEANELILQILRVT